MNKKIVVISFILLLGGLGVYWLMFPRPASSPELANSTTAQTALTTPTQTTQPAGFDKTKYSTSDPASLWVVVNKRRPLPSTYAPTNRVNPSIPLAGSASNDNMHVTKVMSTALEQLVAGGKKDGHSLALISGYRSYATQNSVYNGYVKQYGQAWADSHSARPGHSEHQTGLAADLGRTDGKCNLEACFGTSSEGIWLAAHAHEYGFIIRYREGKQAVTGYDYEPWHIRFLGIELASEIFKENITLEEFFGLGAAANY